MDEEHERELGGTRGPKPRRRPRPGSMTAHDAEAIIRAARPATGRGDQRQGAQSATGKVTALPSAILPPQLPRNEMSIGMAWVSAQTAGAALNFPAAVLAQLRRYGVVDGADSLLDLDDAARVVAELRAMMAPFVGKPILISEAAKKYRFHSTSIYDWIQNGWVKVLIPEPRRRVDEGDIVLARALADRQGHRAGRAVFPAKPRSGRPKKKS